MAPKRLSLISNISDFSEAYLLSAAGRFPSEVIRMRDISAGVPTKAPHAPALIPRPAFLKNPGGLPSGFENFSNRYVYTPRKQEIFFDS